MQANWIGRSEGARLRFALAEPEAGIDEVEVYTTRPDTLFGMSFLAIAPEHPLAAAVAARDPTAAAFIAECRSRGTCEAAIETGGEARLRHRPAGRAPVHRRRDLPGLDRQFRADGIRHRRDLRLPGARPARPGLRPQIRPAGDAGGAAARRGPGHVRDRHDEAYDGAGHDRSTPASSTGWTSTPPSAPRSRALEELGVGKGVVNWRLRDWGVSPPALLGLPDPGHPLRCLRRGAGAGRPVAGAPAGRRDLRPAGQSAGPSPDLEARRLPVLRQAGAARDRHVRHLRRQLLVFRPLLQPARGRADGAGGGRSLDAGRPVYRRHRARDPASALFALLHPGDAARPAMSRSRSRSPACSPRAW